MCIWGMKKAISSSLSLSFSPSFYLSFLHVPKATCNSIIEFYTVLYNITGISMRWALRQCCASFLHSLWFFISHSIRCALSIPYRLFSNLFFSISFVSDLIIIIINVMIIFGCCTIFFSRLGCRHLHRFISLQV